MAKTAVLPPVRVDESFKKEMIELALKENRTITNLIETALRNYKKNKK